MGTPHFSNALTMKIDLEETQKLDNSGVSEAKALRSDVSSFKKWVLILVVGYGVLVAVIAGLVLKPSPVAQIPVPVNSSAFTEEDPRRRNAPRRSLIKGKEKSFKTQRQERALSKGSKASCNTYVAEYKSVSVPDSNVVAKVKKEEVDEAWDGVFNHGTSVRINANKEGILVSESVDTSAVTRERSGKQTVYKGISVGSNPDGNYIVTCKDNKAYCTAASDAGNCFSASTTVVAEGKGEILISELEINDKVLTADGAFQPVYGFGHARASEETDFVQIYTNLRDKPLEMTADHLVYLSGQKIPVPASQLKIGDHLSGAGGQTVEVTKLGMIAREGMYSPFTADGTIVADDVVASTYIAFDLGDGKLSSRLEIAGVRMMSWQALSHMYQTPHRLLCLMVSPKLCEAPGKQYESVYAHAGAKLAAFGLKQSFVVVFVIYLALLLALGPIYVAEQLIWSPTTLVAGLAVFIGIWLGIKQRVIVWKKKSVA